MMKRKIMYLFLMLLTMLCSVTACGSNQANDVSTEKNGVKESKHSIESNFLKISISDDASISVGNVVKFGNYEGEDISWIVLDVQEQDDKALLISEKALDSQPYNDENIDITWEECYIRQWLNEDFMENAFTDKEQKGIILSTLENDKQDDTDDHVFLLSYEEADQYFKGDDERICYPTSFAVTQGAYEDENYDGSTLWFLRSTGESERMACNVSTYGSLNEAGLVVDRDNLGVRPAIWVDLSTTSLEVESEKTPVATEKKGDTTKPTTEHSNDGSCTFCGGSGICPKCDNGDIVCSCLGGECSSCHGKGYKFNYYTCEKVDCSTCGGSGDHARCGGTGWLTCSYCDGTGVCPYCGD